MTTEITTVAEKLYKVSVTSKIVTGWVAYAERNKLRSTTDKYWKAMHAYVNGCNVMLGEQGLPPIIQIYIMSGRDIAEIQEPVAA
jgi:hypothetical protein